MSRAGHELRLPSPDQARGVGMRTTRLLVIVAVLTLLALGSPTVADASNGPTTVGGRATCGKVPPPLPGPAYVVDRVRLQAANGEATDAQVVGAAPLQSYIATLNSIPPGGEQVIVYITCDDSDQWGTQFQVGDGGGFQTIDLDRCSFVQDTVPIKCN